MVWDSSFGFKELGVLDSGFRLWVQGLRFLGAEEGSGLTVQRVQASSF